MSDWWEDPSEVARVEGMLVRSGVLRSRDVVGFAGNVRYFREKPWKWSGEREVGDALERIMVRAGVPLSVGWDMTCADIASRVANPMLADTDRVPYAVGVAPDGSIVFTDIESGVDAEVEERAFRNRGVNR